MKTKYAIIEYDFATASVITNFINKILKCIPFYFQLHSLHFNRHNDNSDNVSLQELPK